DRRDEHTEVLSILSRDLPHPRQLRTRLHSLVLQSVGCCLGLQPCLLELGNIDRHLSFPPLNSRASALVLLSPGLTLLPVPHASCRPDMSRQNFLLSDRAFQTDADQLL